MLLSNGSQALASKEAAGRKNGYALSGILICDHCGKRMYGCQPSGRQYRVYRCSTPAKSGMGTCGAHEIREKIILPFVLQLLRSQLDDLSSLLRQPPEEVAKPSGERQEQRRELEKQRAELAQKIEQAEENLLFTDDPRTRQSFDADSPLLATNWNTETRSSDIEQATNPRFLRRNSIGWKCGGLSSMSERLRWCLDHGAPEVDFLYSVPEVIDRTGEDHPPAPPRRILVDPRLVNEALHAIGAEVRLRWCADKATLSNGKQQNRYTLDRGRFRLGQKTGILPRKVLERSICGTVQWQSRRGSPR